MIAELKNIFETRRTPYLNVLERVQSEADARARKIFGELAFGQMNPKEGEYGKVLPRPEMFSGMAGSALSGTFRQNLTSTGWQTILTADLSDTGEVKSNWVLGIAGLAILDATKRISQIKTIKGDRTFSILDIEDMQAFDGPSAIVFQIPDKEVEMYVFDYSAKLTIQAYVTSTGYQTIKPLGVSYVPHNKAIAETY